MRQRHGVAGQPRAKQASTRCAVSPSASLRLEQRPESASILRPRVPSLSARHNAPQLRAGERGRRDAARGLLPAAEIRVARHDRNGLTLDWPSSPDSPSRVPSGRMTSGTNVGFGAEATHVGINSVILGEWQRRGYGRTPFRMQSARGLLRTTPDDLCCHPPRRSAASLKDKDAFGSGRVGDPCRPFWNQSAPSEAIDSNSSWRLAMSRSAARTSAGSQRDVDTGQVESGGAPPRWLLSAPRRRAASVESLSRTHRSWMSTASNGGPVTKSPPARAPRAADPAPPRGTA